MLVPRYRLDLPDDEKFREVLPLKIAVMGSTGSIGRSALEIVRRNPGRFELFCAAAGSNTDLLLEQVREFHPKYAVVADEGGYDVLNNKAADFETAVLCGSKAVCEAASHPEVDVVLSAIVGTSGLPSTAAALKAGKRVALANKECLVAGGGLVAELVAAGGGTIIPVDSEHSAIFQAVQGENLCDIERLILTASGGPFLNTPEEELRKIVPEQAVKHPNWEMGAKISVDSATMVNKALELIEAYWLFSIPCDRIEVLIHPQSIVHSAVGFVDGSLLAQLSQPDMKGAISYALNYPYGRVAGAVKSLNLADLGKLEFLPLPENRFPAVKTARECVRAGGTAPALFNAANEVAVKAFLEGRLRFDRIYDFIVQALEDIPAQACASVDELISFDLEVKRKLDQRLRNEK